MNRRPAIGICERRDGVNENGRDVPIPHEMLVPRETKVWGNVHSRRRGILTTPLSSDELIATLFDWSGHSAYTIIADTTLDEMSNRDTILNRLLTAGDIALIFFTEDGAIYGFYDNVANGGQRSNEYKTKGFPFILSQGKPVSQNSLLCPYRLVNMEFIPQSRLIVVEGVKVED